MGCSKFTSNVPRKSISMIKKEDSMTDKLSEIDMIKFETLNSEGFRPFYFYTIIKGNIRIILVQKAQITKQNRKLKVNLSGYFCYSLIFHKYNSIFNERI